MDVYEKYIETKLEQLKRQTFCCEEMKRLRIDGFGGNLDIDWDTKTFTLFGTYELDGYDDVKPFDIKYCMNCGAKL